MHGQGEQNIVIREQHLVLHPDRAVFWRERRMLILSDLHLGKAQHFRKNGIPVPASVLHADLKKLGMLIEHYNPATVNFVGDLFHSAYNVSWDEFVIFMRGYPDLSWLLIPGNHDILDGSVYAEAGLQVMPAWYHEGPFSFTHDHSAREAAGRYVISGHLHPGVRMRGRGQQAITLPCFLFGEDHALLPAFGGFTGLARVTPKAGDQIFAVVEGKVLEAQTPVQG